MISRKLRENLHRRERPDRRLRRDSNGAGCDFNKFLRKNSNGADGGSMVARDPVDRAASRTFPWVGGGRIDAFVDIGRCWGSRAPGGHVMFLVSGACKRALSQTRYYANP